MRSWLWPVSLMLSLVTACASETTTAPAGPAFSHTGTPDITGSLFVGPGRRSLCSPFSLGSPLAVRAFAADLSSNVVDQPICPTNSFVLPVVPGSYYVRATLPLDQPLGQLPQRWLEPVPVLVEFADAVQDVHVRDGLPLGGHVTVDGVPEPGAALGVVYGNLPIAGAAFGTSGPAGTWVENSLNRPLILQQGLEYIFSGCQGTPVPGIKSISISPTGPVVFPSGANRFDCEFTSGSTLQYTHQATRLKLTSLPGDIGGVSDPVIYPDLGYGYSAQFPIPAGAAPRAGPALINRQLFRGGLVLAATPGQMISGTELDGFVICAVSPCRGLGFDGQASITEDASGRKAITWNYTDNGSLRPRGLRVIQRSFDGREGDYVLYAFRITNQGASAITFTPGLFLDFDVSPEFFTNIGYTELNGQLMVTTPADDLGRHLGSVVLGAPAGGRSYFSTANNTIQESEAYAGMRGDIANPTAAEPSDVRILQGGATVKLGKGKSTDVWVAIVAGDDRAQIISSARAAIADGMARQRDGTAFTATAGAQTRARSLGHAARAPAPARTGRLCKTGCVPD